jgi:acyl carrier protein
LGPRDDIERTIVDICCEIINIPKIGIQTNFFDVGINSLTTLSLQRKIDKVYPGKIKIQDLIQYPTISDISTLIRSREPARLETSEKEAQYQTFLETISNAE